MFQTAGEAGWGLGWSVIAADCGVQSPVFILAYLMVPHKLSIIIIIIIFKIIIITIITHHQPEAPLGGNAE